MITIEELSLWMKENTSLSDSSIYKYSRAVSTISKQMVERGIIPLPLFEMTSFQCDCYLPIILKHPEFVAKNRKGNNMYSNSLKQYRMFRTANPEIITTQTEIENAIPGYMTLDETEKIAIIKSRIGQGIFRKRLLEKYNSTCIITGISSKKLLISSHIKPWVVSSNEERLSEENGLLLSPTYDKLFDYGLITFTNKGNILISSQLSSTDVSKLNLSTEIVYNLKISSKMTEHLDYHRDVIFIK